MTTPENPGGYSPQQDQSFQTQPGQPFGYAVPAPATQPTRRRRHPVRNALLIVLVLVLLGAGGVFAYAQSVRGAIASAAQSFCTDLKAQNYTGAYALLSSGYQAKVTQQQFTQAGQLHDQIDGKVQSCSASDGANGLGALLQLGSTTVSFPAHITRNTTFSGDMTLVNQGGSWKVDALDQSLQGTSLGPILVASDYCAALASGNIHQAYSDLSSDYQSRLGSEQQYAQTLQSVLTQGVSLTGCTPDLGTYSVTGTTAKLSGALTVQENGVSVNIPIVLTFAESGSGVWKIDSVTVQPQA